MTLTRWILAPSLVASALAVLSSAHAQQAGEVVQATPSAEAVASLNRNLVSLSRNPQDQTALLGAGQAALDLGDMQAANGFFTRANMVNPRLGKAKLGLAIVQIALKQPADAAANFDAAEALGEQPRGHLADRALAYDLTGQQAKAQRDYQTVLRANPADETARLRYAVSLGISGQVAAAEQQLQAGLAASDRESWRMRAFVLAMNGRIAEARKITQAVMPKGLADALDPYMQRLPLLSPDQKAAAAHYGEFPSGTLRMAAPDPQRERDTQVAASTTENNRRGRSSERSATRQRRTASAAPASPRPQAAPQPAARQPVNPAPPPQQQTSEAPTTVALASNVQPTPRAALQPQGPSDPARQPAPAPVSTAPTPAPTPGFSPAAQPISEVSLADALSALEVPEQERQRSPFVADLNAVARIQDHRREAEEAAAAKKKAEADAKAKVEAEARAKAEAARKAEADRKAKLAANPSRNWVQIATGRDVDALAFDLRRMRRTYGDAIGDLDGWTAEWGQTRRLLVGPIRKVEDARAIVAKITKSGGDAFVWQSEAGEEVAQIGGK